MENEIILNEEVLRLQEKLDDLKRQSSRLWEKKDEMLTFEKPHLYSLYQTLLGVLQYDEFALKTELSRLRRKAELMQSAINRNGKPDEESRPSNTEADCPYAVCRYCRGSTSRNFAGSN